MLGALTRVEQDNRLRPCQDATSTDSETTSRLISGFDGRLKYLEVYAPTQGRLPQA